MKQATTTFYPYVRPCGRGIVMDVDKLGSLQIEEWLEQIFYNWGIQSGQNGSLVRITIEVVGGIKTTRGRS
jgi:hypothetical protein